MTFDIAYGLFISVCIAALTVCAAGVVAIAFLVWAAPVFWEFSVVRALARQFGRKV